MSRNTQLTRRGFLRSTVAAGGGIAAVGFAGILGVETALAGHDSMDDVQTILNLAATAETLAVTHYYSALTARSFRLDAEDIEYLKFALDAEQQHLDFLMANGGRALTDSFFVPANLLSDPDVFVATTSAAETAFVGAYLAATRRFAELGNPRLAATAAQVACVESQHLAIARDIGGLVPNNIALAVPVYYNVSDAVPTLTPFLRGGSGFIGPVRYPGKAQVSQALGAVKAIAVPPFTAVF
ncbi:MAG TPA: ferritin-like domain-containing protein [Roseiflexaceae bacterium]|nr:ferritin-like domain-containing protein [Roseiflexaceae bacterium]